MRFFPAIVVLAAMTQYFPTPVLWAQEVLPEQNASKEMARAEAREDLELAKLELRLYIQVEYPRQRRHLDAEIQLAQAEVDAYRARLREYRSIDRFSTGRPLLVPMQDLRLCLLEAELRLRDLQAERNALIRFHSDEWRVREIRVEQARRRLAVLEDDELVVVESDLAG